MDPGPDATVFPWRFDKAEPSRLNAGAQKVDAPAETRDTTELPVIWTHVSRGLAQTHGARMLYAVDAKGGDRSAANHPQDIGEQDSRNGHLRHLEDT